MNKAEFVEYISDQHDCTKIDALTNLNRILTSITSALAEGKEISITGFGKFYTRKIAARKGRNPQTGKDIEIPAMIQARFSVGKTLKDACNKESK